MIKIYVDGASKGNPGPGGSGVVAYDSKNNTILQSYSQYYENITNNQAELKALIYAIQMAKEKWSNEYCIIYSDSAYCVNSCNDWIYTWVRNNWKNSKNIIDNFRHKFQILVRSVEDVDKIIKTIDEFYDKKWKILFYQQMTQLLFVLIV